MVVSMGLIEIWTDGIWWGVTMRSEAMSMLEYVGTIMVKWIHKEDYDIVDDEKICHTMTSTMKQMSSTDTMTTYAICSLHFQVSQLELWFYDELGVVSSLGQTWFGQSIKQPCGGRTKEHWLNMLNIQSWLTYITYVKLNILDIYSHHE